MRPRMWQCTSGSWRYGGCSSPKRCRPRRRVSGSSWDGPGRRPEARSAAGSVRQVGAAAKRMLKEIAYWGLILSGLSWVAARLNRRKALVLLYHGVDAGTLHPVMNFDGLHVRRDLFERQMRHLAAHYHVRRLEALLSRLAADLGVEEHKLQTSRPLSANQLREMAKDGISVGGHGRSHDSFLHLSREQLLAELADSKRVLESVMQRPVHWLAFPYGDFSPEVMKVVIEAGYRGAVTTIEGLNDGIPNRFAIRRIGVDDNMTLAHFIVTVSGLRDFLKGVLRACRRWRSPFASMAPGWPERRHAAYVRDRGEV